MPYTVKKIDGKWRVVVKTTGKVVGGAHDSKQGAVIQLAAIASKEK
jgi:hypothetical protein